MLCKCSVSIFGRCLDVKIIGIVFISDIRRRFVIWTVSEARYIESIILFRLGDILYCCNRRIIRVNGYVVNIQIDQNLVSGCPNYISVFSMAVLVSGELSRMVTVSTSCVESISPIEFLLHEINENSSVSAATMLPAVSLVILFIRRLFCVKLCRTARQKQR